MAEEGEKPIRVVDRRMFTPDGELRPEFRSDQAADFETSPSAAPPRREAQPSPEHPPSTAEPRSDFASIVRSFAATAYSALGLVPDPAGSRHRDPLVARQMIDWLAVLESKTRGNLSFEESDFLSRALYELRLSYVEVTRPPAK